MTDTSRDYVARNDRANARRGACEDAVTLFESVDRGNVGNKRRDGENHVRGLAVLANSVVDLKPELEFRRILDLLKWDGTADSSKGVIALGNAPRSALQRRGCGNDGDGNDDVKGQKRKKKGGG